MKFACPSCGQRLEAESQMSGRQIACPVCVAAITIPLETVSVSGTSLLPAIPSVSSTHEISRTDSVPPNLRGERAALTAGTPLPAVSGSVEESPRAKARRPVWALALALFVVLLGAGGWLLFGSKLIGAKNGASKAALFAL